MDHSFISNIKQDLVNIDLMLDEVNSGTRNNLAFTNLVDTVATQLFHQLDMISDSSDYHFLLSLPFLFCSAKMKEILISSNVMLRINFRVLEMIYNSDSLLKTWDLKEERVRKLLGINYGSAFSHYWQQSIAGNVKNLIFGKSNLKIKVRSIKDLKLVIESWQSLGIPLYWKDIAFEINREFKSNLHTEQARRRIHGIIGPLERYVEELYDLEYQRGDLVNSRRSQIRYNLRRRAKRDRQILDGRHLRDFQMARYYKALYPRCEIDDDSCYGILQLNHKIPLALGVNRGGIDHPINYEVLCEIHHDEVESDLLLNLQKMNDQQIKTYLEDNFHEITERCHKYLDVDSTIVQNGVHHK